MGTSLSGLTPADTYQSLIKVGDNSALSATLKTLSDGAGNNLPMQASSTGINFTGTTTGLTSGVSGAIQFSNGSAFASDAANFFWDNTNKRLGVGTNAPTQKLTIAGSINFSTYNNNLADSSFPLDSGYITNIRNVLSINDGGGAGIYFKDSGGSAYAKMGFGNLNTTIGQSTLGVVPDLGARLGVRGSGSTSATTSLLVQNSGGTELFRVRDDGNFNLANGYLFWGSIGFGSYIGSDGYDMYYNTRQDSKPHIFYSGGVEFVRFIKISATDVRLIVNAGNGLASAILQADSTTQGFLPPRMTTAQKNAIASPAAGLVVYDTTLGKLCVRTASAWETITSI